MIPGVNRSLAENRPATLPAEIPIAVATGPLGAFPGAAPCSEAATEQSERVEKFTSGLTERSTGAVAASKLYRNPTQEPRQKQVPACGQMFPRDGQLVSEFHQRQYEGASTCARHRRHSPPLSTPEPGFAFDTDDGSRRNAGKLELPAKPAGTFALNDNKTLSNETGANGSTQNLGVNDRGQDSVAVFKLQNANPEEVATRLQNMFSANRPHSVSAPQRSILQSRVQTEPDQFGSQPGYHADEGTFGLSTDSFQTGLAKQDDVKACAPFSPTTSRIPIGLVLLENAPSSNPNSGQSFRYALCLCCPNKRRS